MRLGLLNSVHMYVVLSCVCVYTKMICHDCPHFHRSDEASAEMEEQLSIDNLKDV